MKRKHTKTSCSFGHWFQAEVSEPNWGTAVTGTVTIVASFIGTSSPKTFSSCQVILMHQPSWSTLAGALETRRTEALMKDFYRFLGSTGFNLMIPSRTKQPFRFVWHFGQTNIVSYVYHICIIYQHLPTGGVLAPFRRVTQLTPLNFQDGLVLTLVDMYPEAQCFCRLNVRSARAAWPPAHRGDWESWMANSSVNRCQH